MPSWHFISPNSRPTIRRPIALPRYISKRASILVDIERAFVSTRSLPHLRRRITMFWLDLGRARERSGDPEGAEAALATGLANLHRIIRGCNGRSEIISFGRDGSRRRLPRSEQAVAGDATFAGPAASAAWQFFDGDLGRIRSAMGGSSQFDAALAALLARENKFDQAMDVWRGLPPDEKKTSLKEVGKRSSASSSRQSDSGCRACLGRDWRSSRTQIGQVANGGFESAVKPTVPGLVRMADRRRTSAADRSQQRSETRREQQPPSHFQFDRCERFRSVSQTVAVEPATQLRARIFLSLGSQDRGCVQVGDRRRGRRNTDRGHRAGTRQRRNGRGCRLRFTVPANSDGIVIRLVREGCGQVCTIAGSLWFDDVALRRLRR